MMNRERLYDYQTTSMLIRLTLKIDREGEINSIFAIDKVLVEKLLETDMDISFGDCLGKHSNVVSNITEDDIKLITDDIEVVKVFTKHKLFCGINPFYCHPTGFDYTSYNVNEKDVADYDIEDLLWHLLNLKNVINTDQKGTI